MKKLVHSLFLGTLIFAPLAFGTAEQWSLLVVEVLVAAAALAYCFQLSPEDGGLLRVPGVVPLGLLVAWMGVQLLPLPASLVDIVSPSTSAVYKPVYDMLAGNPWMPLTVFRKATVLECVRIAAYAVFYVLTVQILSNGERLKATVKVCSWLAIFIAVLAILQKFTSPHKMYWFRPGPANSSPLGPWVNRSQFCGYMEMMGPLVLALFLYYRPVLNHKESLRRRIVSFFSVQSTNLSILMAFGLVLVATSVFISLGRGGIISFSVSYLLFFILLSRKKSKNSPLVYVGIPVGLILFVAWFGWSPIVQRFDQVFGSMGEINFDRIPIWKDALQIIRHFWLTGSGFGTFVDIFPLYKTIPGNLVYDHAHSDYVELLTDGGIIGFFLAAWFVLSVLREGWKMIGRRRDRYAVLLGIGAMTGMAGMLIHSFTDFNMHNGADGLYFFFLCGLLVAAGNTRFHFQGDPTLLKKAEWPKKNSLVLTAAIFFCLVLLLQGGSWLAMLQNRSVKDIYLSRQLAPDYLQKIFNANQRAARLDPFDGTYSFWQGEVERYMGHKEKALQYYVQAGKKDPLEGAFLQRIALLLPEGSEKNAEVLMEKGAERTLKRNDLMLTWAQWLLGVGKRGEGIKVLREIMERNRQLVDVVIPLLQSFSFTKDEVASVLPARMEDWVQYGLYLEKMGDLQGAQYFYAHSLEFLKDEAAVPAGWFSHVYAFYMKRHEEDKAIEVLRLGSKKAPLYTPFHIQLGDYYARQGITYRAMEEYQQALLQDPQNASVRARIDRLSKTGMSDELR